MPPELYEHAFFLVPETLSSHLVIRTRAARRLLASLRIDQAIGPDDIGAAFLRPLAKVIAVALTILCRRIFCEAVWPMRWQLHHLVPIFKKEIGRAHV